MAPYLALALVSLAACGGPDAAPTPPTPPPGGDAPWTAYEACAVDEDCALVELGCCDACNGGWMLAVNVAHREAASAELGEACAPATACTLMACEPPAAVCVAGVCARRQGDVVVANGARGR